MRPLNITAFKKEVVENGAIIIDARDKQAFADGHIPESVFIGIDDSFAPWVGALIFDLKQPIVFLADEGKEEEVVTRLARVGYDNSVGFLKGGMETWQLAGESIKFVVQITPEVFAAIYRDGKHLMDVRKETEFSAQHIEGATSFPLEAIYDDFDSLDKNEILYLYCVGGYRSMIASSILQAKGFEQIINIQGGFNALKELDIPLTQPKEQTTML